MTHPIPPGAWAVRPPTWCVDAEVARLSRLHCEHQETQFKLRSGVRHLTDELPGPEQRLDAV